MNTNLNRREFMGAAAGAALAAATLPAAFAQTEKKITIALVGGAHIHAPGFIDLVKKRNDVKVKSVWDHDRARAEKRAKELNAQPVSDVKQSWSDPESATLIILSETNSHLDLVLAAAIAGNHM